MAREHSRIPVQSRTHDGHLAFTHHLSTVVVTALGTRSSSHCAISRDTQPQHPEPLNNLDGHTLAPHILECVSIYSQVLQDLLAARGFPCPHRVYNSQSQGSPHTERERANGFDDMSDLFLTTQCQCSRQESQDAQAPMTLSYLVKTGYTSA